MSRDTHPTDLDAWRSLLTDDGARLVDEVEAFGAFDAATIDSLRSRWPADRVRAAIDLVTARRKAAVKFPDAAQLIADTEGVEQATAAPVAAHKAERFAALRPARIIDLCCGIGGDAMALAQHAPVMAVDHCPRRAWMAEHNVRHVAGGSCESAVADVTTLPLDGEVFHLDPSRRAGGRRMHQYAELQPGPDFIESLRARCPTGAIKLSPGLDLDAVPAGEVEMISHDGTLRQAVLWIGDLARHERTATHLPSGATISGNPEPIPVAPARRYLLSVDPAIERAGLIGNFANQLGIDAVHPLLGLLTADQAPAHPMLSGFEVLCEMPWRLAKVRAWLAAHDGGIVEVKTRGRAVNPDTIQRQLRGDGDTTYTVFIMRWDRPLIAWITQRVGSDERD